jgi:hypothetical protein
MQGIAKWTARYDRFGNRTEEAYFDLQNRPVLNKEGYTKVTWRYDSLGRQTEIAFFDLKGEPTRNRDGFSKLSKRYDNRGNVVEETYFNEKGIQILAVGGVSKTHITYDRNGNKTEKLYLDAKNKPTKHLILGIANWKAQYDENGNITEISNFNEKNQQTRGSANFATVRWRYDSYGNLIEQTFLDEHGGIVKPNPAQVLDNQLNPKSRFSYPRWMGRYDEYSRLIQSCSYSPRGQTKGGKEIMGIKKPSLGGAGLAGTEIKIGDRIQRYAGVDIYDANHFYELLADQAGYAPRELVVLRKGKRLTFKLDSKKVYLYLGGDTSMIGPCPINQ